jgi:hypothetical protein
VPEPIGSTAPAEAEERYYAMFDEALMAAKLKPNGLRQTPGSLIVDLGNGQA